MDHRRTPSRKAYVPASWFIVLTIMLCVGAAGWLGWLFVDDDSESPTAGPTPSAPAVTTPSPTKTTESKPTPKPTAEPTPEPTKTTEPEAERDAGVSVLNNTTIQGLAATFSTKVRNAGWSDVTVGNWRGSVGGNTVYYPPALEPQAKLLADDVGIGRVLPSFAPMRTDRLTIILSGPQQ